MISVSLFSRKRNEYHIYYPSIIICHIYNSLQALMGFFFFPTFLGNKQTKRKLQTRHRFRLIYQNTQRDRTEYIGIFPKELLPNGNREKDYRILVV